MRHLLPALLLALHLTPASAQAPELFIWQDSTRDRVIPVAIHHPTSNEVGAPIVIFSHGYGQNTPGVYLQYTYLCEALADAGFFVVSIQHELPSDDLLNFNGPARVVRMPNWERGAANIHFVIAELQRRYPNLDHDRITLAGHSNGGDMSVLYSHQHPDNVWKVITLDHRRMPILRAGRPRTYTLRSSDQPADAGVLPSEAEAQQFQIRVAFLKDTPHNSMDDDADPRQREEIIELVLAFLNE